MSFRQSRVYSLIFTLGAVGVAGMLAGFDKPQTTAPAAAVATVESANAEPQLAEVTKRMVAKKDSVVGALLITKNGELIPVDTNGRVAMSCTLPKDASDKSTSRTECPKTRNTTITDNQPFSVVSHTGSKCVTVSGIFGGKYLTFQIPSGCTP